LAGHKVTVATRYHQNRKRSIINGVKIEEFKISGKEVAGYDAEDSEIKRYRDFLIDSNFDIITNFAAQQWATDLALPILNKIKATKIFVPTGFSELNNPRFNDYFISMKEWMKGYNMNVFLSNDYQDINFARKNDIKNITVIPNGASEEEFTEGRTIDIRKQLHIPDEHFLILVVGSHTGLKGHKEAIKIFKKTKIKKATLLIVGNSTHNQGKLNYVIKFIVKTIANLFTIVSGKKFHPACFISCTTKSIQQKLSFDSFYNQKKLLVKNLSREQTISAYLAADLFLFPSNIECSPLVLFECMASKTPFLTTDVGNSQEIIAWSNAGELLPTKKQKNGLSIANIKQSAVCLENIYAQPDLRESMKKNGFDAFNEKFSWKKISKAYEELYSNLNINN
jgi:glycosyltransferase involved in cell wall biosynthesis